VSVLPVQTTAGAERIQCLQLLIASTVVTGIYKLNCLGLKTSVTSNFGYYNVVVAERTGVLLQACRQLQSLVTGVLLQACRQLQSLVTGVLLQAGPPSVPFSE